MTAKTFARDVKTAFYVSSGTDLASFLGKLGKILISTVFEQKVFVVFKAAFYVIST